MPKESPPTATARRFGRLELVAELPDATPPWVARQPLGGTIRPKLYGVHRVPRASLTNADALLAEARRCQAVDGPNVLRVVDCGTAGEEVFVAFDHVAGETLGALRDDAGDDGVPAPVALRIALDTLGALGKAHGHTPQPVVHGALGPRLVLVGSDGITRVLGFGCAPLLGGDAPHPTPPEAGEGPSVDLWAAAAMLWDTLAGKALPPDSAPERLDATRGAPLPAALTDALERALATEPSGRFATAAELASALEGVGAAHVASHAAVAMYVQRVAGGRIAARRSTVDEALRALAASSPTEARAPVSASIFEADWTVPAPASAQRATKDAPRTTPSEKPPPLAPTAAKPIVAVAARPKPAVAVPAAPSPTAPKPGAGAAAKAAVPPTAPTAPKRAATPTGAETPPPRPADTGAASASADATAPPAPTAATPATAGPHAAAPGAATPGHAAEATTGSLATAAAPVADVVITTSAAAAAPTARPSWRPRGTAVDRIGAGSTLGRYDILMPVARGGMASVWAARLHGTHGFQKIVAIKTMLPDVSDDPDFETMFLDEARVAAKIRHPNVAEILDLGEESEVLYLVMEWVEGGTVGALLRGAKALGGIPFPIVLRIASQICSGLHAAHELHDEEGHLVDLVHRDITPGNVLVSMSGHVKIVDFGIAKSKTRVHITKGGSAMVKGKTPYLSPEQLEGQPIDRRSDIFSFGALLYTMATGLHPFRGDTENATVRNIVLKEPVPPRDISPFIPLELEKVILTALQKKPRKRFESAADLQRALDVVASTIGDPLTDGDVAAFVRRALGDVHAKSAADLKAAITAADAVERTGRTGQVHVTYSTTSMRPPPPAAQPSEQPLERAAPDAAEVAPASPGQAPAEEAPASPLGDDVEDEDALEAESETLVLAPSPPRSAAPAPPPPGPAPPRLEGATAPEPALVEAAPASAGRVPTMRPPAPDAEASDRRTRARRAVGLAIAACAIVLVGAAVLGRSAGGDGATTAPATVPSTSTLPSATAAPTPGLAASSTTTSPPSTTTESAPPAAPSAEPSGAARVSPAGASGNSSPPPVPGAAPGATGAKPKLAPNPFVKPKKKYDPTGI